MDQIRKQEDADQPSSANVGPGVETQRRASCSQTMMMASFIERNQRYETLFGDMCRFVNIS
jgi:hypothetical protein